MKRQALLILAPIFAAALLLYSVLAAKEKNLGPLVGNHQTLSDLVTHFAEKQKPAFSVPFSALYSGRGQLQLLHPLLETSRVQIEEARFVCVGEATEKNSTVSAGGSCLSPQTPVPANAFSQVLRKNEELFRRFKERVVVDEEFLNTPPFLNQKGQSYAYVLATFEDSSYRNKSWVEQHLSYFKVTELKTVMALYQIRNPVFQLLAELSQDELERTIRGENIVVTPKFLLVKDQSRLGFSPLRYSVFELAKFEEFLQGTIYELSTTDFNDHCIEKLGNACWTYNSRYALSWMSRYSMAFYVLLFMFVAVLVVVYVKRSYDKSREQKKHRLSLQVLSHEFRTPVSSLLLMMERLSSLVKNTSTEDQDLLIRMNAEIFRLQRIVEVSRHYLQAEGGKIHFKPVHIESLNDWFTDFISENDGEVQLKTLAQDRGIFADPFWLRFIVSNLIQNALAHGRAPVILRLEAEAKDIRVVVEDHGKCEFTSLKEMTEPFIRSPKSKGMGLGLNIVQYIVDEWGQKMYFSNQPVTTFTLSISGEA